MKLTKKITAIAMAAALVLSGLPAAPIANAQISYETKGVTILTDLVPSAPGKISVAKDGSMYKITSVTNVQFDLDCNVDCVWSIAPASDSLVENATKVTIDSMGHVEIPKGVADGVYTIKAEALADKISNVNRTATCQLTVDTNSDPAEATDIILDKEAIEAQVPAGAITVANDGKSMDVSGTVKNVKLYSIVTPSYLLKDYVNFECNSGAVTLTNDTDLTKSLFTSSGATDSATLRATAGIDTDTKSITAKLANLDFAASINCDNIPASDKNSNTYTIRANEDIDFYIDENTARTLPARQISSVEWTVNYNDDATKVTGTSYECDLGKFNFSDGGRFINLITPIKGTADYEKYKKALDDKKSSLTLTAQVKHFTGTDAGAAATWTSPIITLKFLEEENSFSQAELDFSSALTLNQDYVVKKETLNGKEVNVYYIESDNRKLDFAAMTVSNVPGVRDFEAAKVNDFYGSNVKYTINYAFSNVEDASFGANEEARKKYRNNNLKAGELTAQNILDTSNRTLTKTGIGYKMVTLTTTGDGNKQIGEAVDYYLRFVSDAVSPNIIHTAYKTTDNEYQGNAVIHVRQGEADMPEIHVNGEKTDVSRINPYMEYTFEPIWETSSSEAIASATIDKTTGTLRINGLTNGKVRVIATSTVDKRQSDSYILYVNDEVMGLGADANLQIDISDAVSKGVMTETGDVNGRIENIQLDVTASGTNVGIPKVTWSSSDESFATITQDGKLTTLKSTGTSSVTITATSISDPTVKATLNLKIKDVAATGISVISEKVAQGQTPVITTSGDNAGTCKAYTTFTLEGSKYVPANATTADGKITWSSGDESVATIDAETGKVTTLKEGTVTITATYSSSSTETSKVTYNLTVAGFAENVVGIQVTPQSLTFAHAGLSETLTATVIGNVTDKTVSFVSANTAVATVTETGSVTAKSAGTTVITVTSNADSSFKVTVPVKVEGSNAPQPNESQPPASQNMTASVAASTIAIGGKTTVTVKNASGAVTFSSSNTKVATVNAAGVVTGKKAGTVTITAKSGTLSATVKVTVAKNPVIKLAKKTIKKKKSTTVKISNKAKGAKVTYTLDKKGKKVVKVSKSGKVTGKKKGKASITVTVKQYGKTYKKKLTIKVK